MAYLPSMSQTLEILEQVCGGGGERAHLVKQEGVDYHILADHPSLAIGSPV